MDALPEITQRCSTTKHPLHADLTLSPIMGMSLGKGFNLIGLAEFPTEKTGRDTRCVLFQFGFNKNF